MAYQTCDSSPGATVSVHLQEDLVRFDGSHVDAAKEEA